MKNANLNLKIVQIFPKLLDLCGVGGNLLTLEKRCKWREIDTEIIKINSIDEMTFDFDICLIGGGSQKQQIQVANELNKLKDNFKEACSQKKVILALAEGFQLLGNYFELKNGDRIKGLELLDMHSIVYGERFVSPVVADCDLIAQKKLIGFENHASKTFLNNSTKPLAKILQGSGNNGQDKTEGAHCGSVFGTYLNGPILPLNPQLADYLLELALSGKYNDNIKLNRLNDTFEQNLIQKLSVQYK